jgi:hypothetical protein
LPEAWDPAEDKRLTVWEATQQLIRPSDSPRNGNRRPRPSARVPAVRDLRTQTVGRGSRRLQHARHSVARDQSAGRRPVGHCGRRRALVLMKQRLRGRGVTTPW